MVPTAPRVNKEATNRGEKNAECVVRYPPCHEAEREEVDREEREGHGGEGRDEGELLGEA